MRYKVILYTHVGLRWSCMQWKSEVLDGLFKGDAVCTHGSFLKLTK